MDDEILRIGRAIDRAAVAESWPQLAASLVTLGQASQSALVMTRAAMAAMQDRMRQLAENQEPARIERSTISLD